jgi:hypothetical protein
MTTLEQYAREVERRGPDRVVVGDGHAAPSQRARQDYGIMPVVIFIRADGWSLGAPVGLIRQAWEMWELEWIGIMLQGVPGAIPIDTPRDIDSGVKEIGETIQRHLVDTPSPDVPVTGLTPEHKLNLARHIMCAIELYGRRTDHSPVG